MDVSFAYQIAIAKLTLLLQIFPAFLMLWKLVSTSLITEAGFNTSF